MFRMLLFSLTLCVALVVDGQSPLPEYESDVQARLERMVAATDDAVRVLMADSLETLIQEMALSSGAFEYAFDGFRNMGVVDSPDGRFRMFNWNIPFSDETHWYRCLLLFKDKQDFLQTVLLKSDGRDPSKPEQRVLKPEQWIGALYYEIIPLKSKGKQVYTLLGWDGRTKTTTRKVIEVMTIDGDKIRFGANIFKGTEGNKKRYFMEYADEVMVSLKFDPKAKRILMDHVSPRDPALEGVYAYYGPDMTFDAFNLEKGKWIFERDADARLQRGDVKGPYNDPNPDLRKRP